MNTGRSLLISLFFTLGASPSAQAAGSILLGDQEVHRHEGPARPEGKTAEPLLRRLTGVSFGRWEFAGSGWVLSAQNEATAALSITSAEVNMPLGQISLGTVQAVRLGPSDPFRLRFELARSAGAPFCHDENGKVQLPFVGRLDGYCEPSGIFGLGFTVLELQSNPQIGKFGARWIETTAEANFFGNGQTHASLLRKLALSLGMSADSIFGVEEHHLRGIVALNGMYRTTDGNWELRARAAVRPSLISTVGAWSDRAWEAALSVDRHFAVSRSWLMNVGLRLQYDKWDRPGSSLGAFASSVRPENWSFMLSWGGRFEYSDY